MRRVRDVAGVVPRTFAAAALGLVAALGLSTAPALADDPPSKSPPPGEGTPPAAEPKKPAAEPKKSDPPPKDDAAKQPAVPHPGAKGDPPADPPAKDGGPRKDAAAEKGESRVERAKKLVRELEVSLESARAAKPADAELVRALETSLELARALAKPLTLADLSEEERKNLTDEVKKQLEPAGLPDKNPVTDVLRSWEENAVGKAFEGADLNDDEQTRARKIISEWFSATGPARMEADWKRVNDLKRDRDDRLVQALGKKKAQKVIHNLNAMSGWGPGRK